ncbi:MAG: GGDEF domain-containing protein, partial [Aeromonas veronii]
MDASLLLKLDIFTLMIMALCGYCLGFLTLTIIRVTHNDIPGVGVWWWSSLFAMLGQAGFASLLLTPTPYGSWVGNVFLIFHVSLLLVAQRCFFRQSPGWPVCWGFILLFAAVMTWSVAIDGRIAVRVMISSATFLMLSTLIIWQLWRHGRPDYQVAVWVLIGLNLVLIAMTLMRIFTVWGEVIESPFQRQLFNVLPYVSMLVGSSMLTFGVLLLCNQHRALELRYQASHDPLTGLFNRRGFMERLARGRPAQQGALVVLDLDDFKQINERHGHEVGDRVLEQVGLALRELEGVLASR